MTRSNGKERLRFSLAVAFGGLTIASIAIAALRNGEWRWARVMFTVTLGLVLAAILGAVYRTELNRIS